MATTYKVLGQLNPAATTASVLYTAPNSTQTVVSTISVCNRGSESGTFRISVRPNGATLANQHYIAYDASVSAKDTVFITVGISLDSSDILEIYASSSDFSFSAFGSEIV